MTGHVIRERDRSECGTLRRDIPPIYFDRLTRWQRWCEWFRGWRHGE